MSVLLTRPERDSREIAAELAAHGVASVIWPLTRIERVARRVSLPDEAEALLFTSGNGVRAFAEACARRDLPALCVGARTAALAREAGFVDVRSAEGDATALTRLAAGHFRKPPTFPCSPKRRSARRTLRPSAVHAFGSSLHGHPRREYRLFDISIQNEKFGTARPLA